MHWTYFVLLVIGIGLGGGLLFECMEKIKGRIKIGGKAYTALKAGVLDELRKDASRELLSSAEHGEKLDAQEAEIKRLSEEVEFMKRLLEDKRGSD